MSDSLLIDLFAEDHAHQAFLHPLITRICREERRSVELRVRPARGGHPRVLRELDLYQRGLERLARTEQPPDLVVILKDANCAPPSRALRETEERIAQALRERSVVGCPDPHIERWYLADPASFARVVGVQPRLGRRKCVRDIYKAVLAKAVVDGGHPPTLGGMEFARDLVREMDLYAAGKREPSLGHFVRKLRGRVKRLRVPPRRTRSTCREAPPR
jgi:hypothetical protein